MNEKNQHVSDEQIDALIRSGLWQDEQPLTADEEKLADAAFARAMAKIDRKAKRQKRRTVLHMLDRVVRVAACLIDLAAAADVPLEAAGVHEGRQRVLVKARHGRQVPRKPFAIARHQRIRQHQIADAQSGGKAFRKGVDVHDTACPIQLA